MNATATVSRCFTTQSQYYDWYFLSAVPYNEGTHVKYFIKGRDVYEEYYGNFIRCSEIFDPTHKPVMHAKMIDWLRTTDRCPGAGRARNRTGSCLDGNWPGGAGRRNVPTP